MITSFDSLLSQALSKFKPTIAVAAAEDEYVLRALSKAVDMGICSAILVGDGEKLEQIAKDEGIKIADFQVVSVCDKAEACATAVSLVRTGEAQAVMKGLVDTSVFLRAVLDKETGIRSASVLSHVGVFEVPNFDRLLLISDAALNMYPDVEQKQSILENTVVVANALEIDDPIAACVCAIEKLNPKMQPTVDAAELVMRNKAGQIKGCRVTGPLALDNALFVDAAVHKGITDPLAGKADILLMPNIETGNVLYKSLAYLAKARNAGVLIGAQAPVVLTSRSDHEDTKINSIALAIRIALSGRIQE